MREKEKKGSFWIYCLKFLKLLLVVKVALSTVLTINWKVFLQENKQQKVVPVEIKTYLFV